MNPLNLEIHTSIVSNWQICHFRRTLWFVLSIFIIIHILSLLRSYVFCGYRCSQSQCRMPFAGTLSFRRCQSILWDSIMGQYQYRIYYFLLPNPINSEYCSIYYGEGFKYFITTPQFLKFQHLATTPLCKCAISLFRWVYFFNITQGDIVFITE